MKYYFKKTFCGMVLMIGTKKVYKNAWGTYLIWRKASEAETTEFMLQHIKPQKE